MVKYRIKVKADEIEIVLDHLVKGLTDAKHRKDPKRADAVYETYQTFGQALGSKNIILEFVEPPQEVEE